MAIESKLIEVDGKKYRVKKFGGKTTGKVMSRLFLGAAQGKLVPGDIDWLVELLAEQTQVGVVDDAGDKRVTYVGFDTLPGGFDDYFAGDPIGLLKWAGAALDVSFGSFLGVLQALESKQKELFESSSTAKSTGSSGESSSAPASTSSA
jgi:hypothetical protein